MPSIKNIIDFHMELIAKIQLIEKISIKFYEEKASLSEERFMEHFKEFSRFYKKSIVYHFKVEEQALFPVLKERIGKEWIENILEEHRRINGMFRRFEEERDHMAALEKLRGIIEAVKEHAEKENIKLRSLAGEISREELQEINRLMCRVNI